MGNRQRRKRLPRPLGHRETKQVREYERRLIGFLDILGFQSRMVAEPLPELHERLATLIDDADREAFAPYSVEAEPIRKKNFEYAAFHSDSIVLVSRPLDGNEAGGRVFNFIAACCHLLHLGFTRHLPLRGCISFGKVLHDGARRILLSEAVPSMLKLEKAQAWSGCVVMPAAESYVASLLFPNKSPTQADVVVPYPVPFTKDQSIERPCLNWVSFMSEKELDHGFQFLKGPKLENTRAFAEYVRSIPSNAETVPAGSDVASCRAQVTPFGVRVQFENADGERIDPQGFKFIASDGHRSFEAQVTTEQIATVAALAKAKKR